MSRCHAALLGLLLASMPLRAARAEDEHRRATLAYVRAPEANACPDEEAFRMRVASRLGYDPFEPIAPRRVEVALTGRGSRIVAEVRVDDEQRKGPATRRLEDRAEHCSVLVDVVASAVAIAIDPLARPASASPPVAAGPSPSSPASLSAVGAPATPRSPAGDAPPAAPGAESPTPAPAVPILPYLLLDGIASYGAVIDAALGVEGGVGLRRGPWSLALEGRVEANPGAVEVSPRDRVTSSLFSGALVPCVGVDLVSLCLGGRLGSLQATALDVTRPSLDSSLVGAIFVRGVASVPLAQAWSLRLGLEGAAPLVRTTFTVGGSTVWTAPAVQGTLLVGVGWRSR